MNVTPQARMNFSNSSSVSRVDTTPYLKFISALGLAAALENICILIVLCSRKRLLHSSSLLIGLTIGHGLNGLIHAVHFWPRVYPTPLRMITPLSCLLKEESNLFLAQYQLLPLVLSLLGLERCLAVTAPLWYREKCTPRRLWTLTILTYGSIISIMLLGLLAAYFDQARLIGENCLVNEIFGVQYMIYAVHAPAVAGGLLATLFTIYGILIGYRRLSKLPRSSKSEIDRMNRQIRLTKCVLMVGSLDVVCVVIPNLGLALYNAGWIPSIRIEYILVSAIVYCLDSLLNVIPYLLFNKDFRRACFSLARCQRVSSVEPLSHGAAYSQHQPRRSVHADHIHIREHTPVEHVF